MMAFVAVVLFLPYKRNGLCIKSNFPHLQMYTLHIPFRLTTIKIKKIVAIRSSVYGLLFYINR